MPIDLSSYYPEDDKEEPSSSLDLSAYYAPEEPKPEAIKPEKPTTSFLDDIAGAFSSGYRNMKAGVEATDYMLGAATPAETAVEFMDVIKNQRETPEYYRRFTDKFQKEGQDVSEAEGVWDTTVEAFDLLGSAMLESMTNPKGLAYAVAESAAQSLPAIAFGAAGGIAGTAAGPIGTVVGASGGVALGTYAVEAGAHLKEQVVDHLIEQGRPLSSVTEADIIEVLEDEKTMDWMESEAQKRGLAVGAVEGITAAFGGKLLVGAAKDSILKKTAKGAGALTIEAGGEALGETAGQLATEGPMNYGDIAMEAFTGLGQSVATTGVMAGLTAGQRARRAITPKAAPVELPGEADIAADIVPEAYQGDNLTRLMSEAGNLTSAPAQPAMPPRGDSLSQELDKGAQQTRDIGQQSQRAVAQQDALDVALADEHPGAQAELGDMMQIVDAHPELRTAFDYTKEHGATDFDALRGIFDAAQQVAHPTRTEGQRAILEFGEGALQQATSPIENLRRSSPVTERPIIPELQDVEVAEPVEMAQPVKQPADIVNEAIKPTIEVTPDVKETPTIDLSDYVSPAQPSPTVSDVEVEVAKADLPPAQVEAREPTAEVEAVTPEAQAVPAPIPTAEPRASITPEVEAQQAKAVDAAAQEAQTSKLNDLPEPSQAQIEAGNYKKGHVKVQGLDIAIENPKGSERKGTDPDGKEWSTEMKDHYGYVKRTEGADGDAVDVFIGDTPSSDKVFVVDQVDPATGKFDEHKVVLGAVSEQQAQMFYNRNYSKDWKGAGPVTEMTADGFKRWLKLGDTKVPAAKSTAFLPTPTAPTETPEGGISIGAAVKGTPTKDFVAVTLPKPVHKYNPAQFKKRLGTSDTVLVDGKAVDATKFYADSLKAVEVSKIPPAVRVAAVEHISPFSPAITAKAMSALQESRAAGETPSRAWSAFIQKGDALAALEVEAKAATVAKRKAKPEVVTTKKGAAPDIKHQFTEVKRLKDEGLHASLAHMAANTDNKAHAAIIERILPHISDAVKVNVISVGDATTTPMNARASTDINFETGKIDFNIKDESHTAHGMYDETIIHESIHVATMELIEKGKLKVNAKTATGKAVMKLYKVQNAIMKHINARITDGTATEFEKSQIAGAVLGDLHEVVAWGLTSTMFQSYLKTVPYSGKTSLWTKFTRTLAELLGIPSAHHTALAEIMESTDALLESDYRQSNELREKMQAVSKQSVSFKKAKAVIKQQFELAQLETQRTNLAFERDNKMSIKAGKQLKDIDAQIKTLNEEIDEQRSQDSYFDEGEGGVFDIVDRITAKPVEMMTIRERMAKWVSDHAVGSEDVRRFFGTKVTDIYAIEEMERQAYGKRKTAEVSPTALSLQAKNAQVTASVITAKHGVKLVDNQMVVDHDMPGLEVILEPVAKLGNKYLRLWETWAVVKRSERLMAEGREKFVLEDDIQAIKNYVDSKPNLKALFEGSHAQYQKLNKANMQLAIDSGWINEQDAFGGYRLVNADGKVKVQEDGTLYAEMSDAMEAAPEGYHAEHVDGWFHDDYIPFNRIDDTQGKVKGFAGAGKIGQVRKGVIGLKGGIGQIPVLENMTKNIAFLVSGSMRTIAMRETVSMVQDVAVEKIEDGGVAPMIDKESAAKLLDQVGIPSEGITDEAAQRWQRMFMAVKPTGKDSVVVYENGRPHHYRVLDPHLLTAVKNIGAEQTKTWLKVIGMPTRLLSKSITVMPSFIVKNFVRELQNAYTINEKAGLNPFATVAKATKNFGKLLKADNPEMMAMMAQGAVNFNSYYRTAPTDVRTRLTEMGVKKSALRNIVEAPWTGAKAAWQVYNRIAVASEYANRLSVRQDYLDSGASEAEANYQALDVLNFSRKGEGAVMEFLLATVPFLNPRIQGLDRLYRGGKSNWKSMAMKSGIMAGAAVALALWNWEMNGEEMEELKEEDKDMFFHFWVGGEHFRVPKGFEVGQIAGTMPERIVEQIMSDNPEPVGAAFRRFTMMTFGLQAPQFVKPIAEVAANEDFFRQRPILSLGQQFSTPKQQYDAYTSKLFIDIAQSMPSGVPDWAQSPKQLEHLFKAYTGSMGFMVLDATNALYSMTGNAPDMPTKQLSQRYIIRDYYRSGTERTGRSVDRVYKMMTDVSKIAAGLKQAAATSASEYRGIVIENREKLQIRKGLNKVSNAMSKLSAQSKVIMASKTMSGDEKYRRLQAITKQRNAIAKAAVAKYWHIFEG